MSGRDEINKKIDQMIASGHLPLRVERGDALDRVERACIAVDMAIDDGRLDQAREAIVWMNKQLPSYLADEGQAR